MGLDECSSVQVCSVETNFTRIRDVRFLRILPEQLEKTQHTNEVKMSIRKLSNQISDFMIHQDANRRPAPGSNETAECWSRTMTSHKRDAKMPNERIVLMPSVVAEETPNLWTNMNNLHRRLILHTKSVWN